MADVKVPNLPALSGTVASDDEVVIVDTSTGVVKTATIAQVTAGVAGDFATDAEVAAAVAAGVAAHESDTTNVHGITDTATLYRSGGTDVAVTDGGTGASTAAAARVNLDAAVGAAWTYTLGNAGSIVLPLGLGTIPLSYPSASASVQHYYVDYIAGNNASAGTSTGTALQYIETAAGKITSDTGVIFVKGSAGPVRRTWVPAYTGKTIWVVPWPGETSWDFYPSKAITSGWSLGGSVYSQTIALTSAAACTVTTLTDADGNQTRLARNTGTPTTPAAGEYGYTGGVLYVRLPGDANPGSHTIEAAHYVNAANVQGASTYYLVGCRTRYAGSTGLLNGGSVGNPTSAMILIDCDTSYNGGNGVGTSVTPADTHAIRCKSYCNGDGTLTSLVGDGFNHGANAGNTSKMVLVDCQAAFNTDEGASPHQDGVMYIFGGRLNHNRSGGYASVHQAVGYLYGVTVDNNHKGGSITSEGAIGVFNTSSVTVDGCTIANNTGPANYVASTAFYSQRASTSWGNGTTEAALIEPI